MDRRPIEKSQKTRYPTVRQAHRDGARVRRWIAVASLALATGGIAGCDTLEHLLWDRGPRLAGDVACPTTPAPPSVAATGEEPPADDDSAEP